MNRRQATLPEVGEPLFHALREALDTRRMGERLRHRWIWASNRGLELETVQVHRVFPRGRGGFVVKYRLELSGADGSRTMDLFGQLVAGDPRAARAAVVEKLRKSRRKQVDRRRDTDAVIALSHPPMLLRVPGYDEKLPGLLLHHQPGRAAEFVERLTGRTPEAPPRFTLLNHRLGKRCVLRLDWKDSGGRQALVLRCLKEKERHHQTGAEQLQALQRRGFGPEAPDRIHVPRLLGVDHALHAVAIELLPGHILGTAGPWPLEEQACCAGLALAKLHRTPPWMERHHTREDELALLRDWVALAGRLRPELAALLEAALIGLAGDFAALPASPLRLAHRDFYERQLLYDGRRIGLIDFDTLCTAEPALDLGNHLAHRLLAHLAGEPWSPAEDGAFLRAYAEQLPLPPVEALRTWRNAALLRLACLYATRTGWEQIPARLIDAMGETP